MGVREDTLDMLRAGLSPKDISQQRDVNINTTLGYLDQLVGRGDLRRSDILFTVPQEMRSLITAYGLPGEDYRTVYNRIQRSKFDVDPEDVQPVQKYRDARHVLGDMYEDIRAIETYLHAVIGQALLDEYEESETGWWRQGIPESVRKSCVVRQEEDPAPVEDPYCYTDLLDLWHILDKKWAVLSKVLPDEMTTNKQDLRRKLVRLNTIRRNVMHPVRGVMPSEDDFEFVHDLKELIIGTDHEEG